MINLFMEQKQRRSSRTSPATEANNHNKRIQCNKCQFVANSDALLKDHVQKHAQKCSQCEETFKTKGLLKRHIKVVHGHKNDEEPACTDVPTVSIKCDKCDFQGKSKYQMEKHMKVRHEDNQERTHISNKSGSLECTFCDFRGKSRSQMEKHQLVRHMEKPECHFWRRGLCRQGSQCNFAHTALPPVCRYSSFCLFWPRCKFSHPEMCKFQNECANSNCNFVHVNTEELAFLWEGRKTNIQQQSQEPPVWRPW